MASWPRLYLRFWTLLCSKSLAVSPILHSNNNIFESPGINKARATLRHRNPFNDSSLKVRKLEWVSAGLSESCHHRVIGVLTCDQPPAHVSPVLCCVVKAVSDPCVLYLGCLHHASGRESRDNNADNCLTDAHKRLEKILWRRMYVALLIFMAQNILYLNNCR